LLSSFAGSRSASSRADLSCFCAFLSCPLASALCPSSKYVCQSMVCACPGQARSRLSAAASKTDARTLCPGQELRGIGGDVVVRLIRLTGARNIVTTGLGEKIGRPITFANFYDR